MRGVVFLHCLALIMTELHLSNSKGHSSTPSAFPSLAEISNQMPDLGRHYEIAGCRLRLLSGSCLLTVLPEKAHCLTLGGVLQALQPQFFRYVRIQELKPLMPFRITVFYINTCLQKVTYVTSAEGRLALLPKLMELQPVVAELSIPIPFGDYEMTSRGTWRLDDYQMTVKVSKGAFNDFIVSGSMKNSIPVRAIARKFDLSVLPGGALESLLVNLGVENFIIHHTKLTGRVMLEDDSYELVFSGVPELRQITDIRVKVFVTKKGNKRNLALLFEFQDYSPVTLLTRIYGPTISRMNLLRDRNQTLALFITNQDVGNFSHATISHGSSRWIHRHSRFQPGATLLVTLPFPHRKALDMKLQLYADGLEFDLPEGESLPADLALGAISPSEIVHVDKDTRASLNHMHYDDTQLERIKILHFRYFILNDTYVAAASQLDNFQLELESLMPKTLRSVTSSKPSNVAVAARKKVNPLDMFFKRSQRQD